MVYLFSKTYFEKAVKIISQGLRNIIKLKDDCLKTDAFMIAHRCTHV